MGHPRLHIEAITSNTNSNRRPRPFVIVISMAGHIPGAERIRVKREAPIRALVRGRASRFVRRK